LPQLHAGKLSLKFGFLIFADLITDERYIERCLQLALLGNGRVAPNPMVGAVLVHNDQVIGEGYHQFFGGAHAEVNCFESVTEVNKPFISQSTLYVSLEPCAHYGKTPPCADRIVLEKVKRVVIACRDPFAKVNGQGIEKLKTAGIPVFEDVLRDEAVELNKAFFNFHLNKRPYIYLKWAMSNDGFIAGQDFQQIAISNEISNRYTHQLRATVEAIMIGTNTAIHDRPSLTTRLWPGKNPTRIIIDKNLKVPMDACVFNDEAPVVVINYLKDAVLGNQRFVKVSPEEDVVPFILHWLYTNGINSLLVEGGATLLQSFIDNKLWDEIITIENTALRLHRGIVAPVFTGGTTLSNIHFRTDTISIYKND